MIKGITLRVLMIKGITLRVFMIKGITLRVFMNIVEFSSVLGIIR